MAKKDKKTSDRSEPDKRVSEKTAPDDVPATKDEKAAEAKAEIAEKAAEPPASTASPASPASKEATAEKAAPSKDESDSKSSAEDKDAEPAVTAVSAEPAPAMAPVTDAEPAKNARERLVDPATIDTDVDPNTAAPAPGVAPPGDARSMRQGERFCLIYRHKQWLVRRSGAIGTVGTWQVTEYPSMAAAAHAYAQDCSDLTGAGFTDVRG